MKKIIRFLLCYVISFLALYLSGYVNLMDHVSPSLATTTFFLSALVLAVITAFILEMYLSFKTEINELSERVDKLETENKKLKNDMD